MCANCAVKSESIFSVRSIRGRLLVPRGGRINAASALTAASRTLSVVSLASFASVTVSTSSPAARAAYMRTCHTGWLARRDADARAESGASCARATSAWAPACQLPRVPERAVAVRGRSRTSCASRTTAAPDESHGVASASIAAMATCALASRVAVMSGAHPVLCRRAYARTASNRTLNDGSPSAAVTTRARDDSSTAPATASRATT